MGAMPWRVEGRKPTRAELLTILPEWMVDGREPTAAEMRVYRLEQIELADANERQLRPVELGEICAFCGVRFAEGHGTAVACDPCWQAHPGERNGIEPATKPLEIVRVKQTPGRGRAHPGVQAGATSRAAGTR